MSDGDRTSHLQRVVADIFSAADEELGLSLQDLRTLLSRPPRDRSEEDDRVCLALGTLADRAMRRRPLTLEDVDGFYEPAGDRERPGESLFVNGMDALRLHSYPTDVVDRLSEPVVSRFFGLGNVWLDVVPRTFESVIDVGCGAGVDLAVAQHLGEFSTTIVGVDKRSWLFPLAAEACPRADLRVVDIMAADSIRGSFELVIANGLPPLQRPVTMMGAARALCDLVAPTGSIAATVIAASPEFIGSLADVLAGESAAFVEGFSMLITGKPSEHQFVSAFSVCDHEVRISRAPNPYRVESLRERTALFHLSASRRDQVEFA